MSWTRISALGVVVMSLGLSIWMQAPERPGALAPDGFSLTRAKQALATLAAKPRPRGSEQHALAREFLLTGLNGLGLRVELQRGAFDPMMLVSERASGADRGASDEGQLANILGFLEGTDSTGTLLLMAHYDSVLRSPGAGDDGSGTVAVLEAMRSLTRTRPRNDVIALFTDGEEEGLRGAQLFANEHPLFDAVDVVLNFEAIGNGGPLLMFETGPDSGGLVDLWASEAPQPRGNTLAPVIYGWLPNDTDFSVFRDAGKRGLNFAIAGGSGAYHQPFDTPERFEDRALAHSARTAIALAQSLGAMDLDQLAGGSRSFDSQPLLGAASWSGRAHLWIAAAIILLWVVLVTCRSRISAMGLLRGSLAAWLTAAGAGLAAFAVPRLWFAIAPPALPASYDQMHLLLALMLVSALAATLIIMFWSERSEQRVREMCGASPFTWIVLFGFFAWVDFEHMGASYGIAWATGGACLASLLRLRGHSPLFAALVLAPGLFEVGPILAQLIQLSSQDLAISLRLGGMLISLGALLVLPALTQARGPRTPG